MYQPQSRGELFDILDELQTYAQVEGLPELSEHLADAIMILHLDEKQAGQPAAAQPRSEA